MLDSYKTLSKLMSLEKLKWLDILVCILKMKQDLTQEANQRDRHMFTSMRIQGCSLKARWNPIKEESSQGKPWENLLNSREHRMRQTSEHI